MGCLKERWPLNTGGQKGRFHCTEYRWSEGQVSLYRIQVVRRAGFTVQNTGGQKGRFHCTEYRWSEGQVSLYRIQVVRRAGFTVQNTGGQKGRFHCTEYRWSEGLVSLYRIQVVRRAGFTVHCLLLFYSVLPVVVVTLFLGPAHDFYINKIEDENGTEVNAM